MAFLFSLVSSSILLIDFVLFIVLHILPTGYHPIRHAVSDYGVGKYRLLFHIRLWLGALGVLALAAALFVKPGTPPLASWNLILLALLAPIRIAITMFPTDIEGKSLTRIGLLHYLFAILNFAFMYTLISNMSPALQTLPAWQGVKDLLGFLAMLTLPALIAVVVTMFRPLRRIFGLFERIFLVTTILWFLLVSIFLFVSTF